MRSGGEGSEDIAAAGEASSGEAAAEAGRDRDGSAAGGNPLAGTTAYQLFGHSVVLREGACDTTSTGWRTWAGGWLLVRHLERRAASGDGPRGCVLDLSCGTGLAGIALARAGHEAVLCDLPVNVPTVCANAQLNGLVLGKGVHVVGYTWGRPLPAEMQRPFCTVLCGDILFHVWRDRLLSEFLATLQDLQRRAGPGFELLFGGQVRSGRQEDQVLATVSERLGLSLEEFEATPADGGGGGGGGTGDSLLRQGRHRLVRLRAPQGGAAGAAA